MLRAAGRRAPPCTFSRFMSPRKRSRWPRTLRKRSENDHGGRERSETITAAEHVEKTIAAAEDDQKTCSAAGNDQKRSRRTPAWRPRTLLAREMESDHINLRGRIGIRPGTTYTPGYRPVLCRSKSQAINHTPFMESSYNKI
jgi:hypothetical protein